MKCSQQIKSRKEGRAQRISAVFAAVLMTVSLVTMFYQPPAEAGVTTWPDNMEVSSLSTGSEHTCAVAGGKAYCWGENGNGQLGNGSTADSLSPVAVSTAGVLGGKTVTAISAGHIHTCAIADGAAYCWGSNLYNQTGHGSSSTVPVAVSTAGVLNGKTITAISAGTSHTCAVATGLAYCWGRNNYGELGNNSTTLSNVPVAVSTAGVLNGKTVTAISAATASHTCAIADGAAYCWGDNYMGQLGNNSFDESSVPVAVDTTGVLAGKIVTAIKTGFHTCAIADGAAYCWGENYMGQLGNNSLDESPVPVAVDSTGVLAGKTVDSIAAHNTHTCVVATGATYCWGDGYYGQLGDTEGPSWNITPVAVDTSGVLGGKQLVQLPLVESTPAPSRMVPLTAGGVTQVDNSVTTPLPKATPQSLYARSTLRSMPPRTASTKTSTPPPPAHRWLVSTPLLGWQPKVVSFA